MRSNSPIYNIWDLDADSCCVVFGFAAFGALATTPGLLVADDDFGNVWFVDLPYAADLAGGRAPPE